MSERDQRIKLLLDRVEKLLAKAEAYGRPGVPRWRRFLWAYPRFLILRRAESLMDEISALNGRPRPAEKWLGMGRAGWLGMQFFFGVLNGWAAIDSAAKAHWFGASVSFICVFVTAHWQLPYKPPRLR